MAINVSCPECKQKLRVPSDWLGQTVECPDCGKSFQAAKDKDTEDSLAAGAPGSGPPPLPAAETKAADDEEFAAPLEDDEGPGKPRKKKRAKRRSDRSAGGYFGELQRKEQKMMTPHRGVLILILGVISLLCMPSLVVGFICGAFAYQMGTNDLNEMLSRRMDRSGEGLTKTGRILGIVGMCLSVFVFISGCCMSTLSMTMGGKF